MDAPRLAVFVIGVAAICACSSAPISEADSTPDADSTTAASALGDGNASSVKVLEIYTPSAKVPLSATALAFNAAVKGELWVTLRQFPSNAPCTPTDNSGCSALQGVVAVITDATGPQPSAVIKEDGNSWHFMRLPSSISWGDGELFATCGEGYTDNYESDPTPYAGPVLWNSDPSIFGVKPTAGMNGTHIDMLHETPYCMGIAHESKNAYWVVNGNAGSLDRYDFHTPHEPGGADHSDGEVYRYITGQLARTPGVPSHLVYDAERQRAYVADTGNGRVLSVDPSTATDSGPITTYEELDNGSGARDGATVVELVPPGLLQAPSGLSLAGGVLFVSDDATSIIYAFDTAGAELAAFDTGLPAGSLAGITYGPDQKLYFTDMLSGTVRRIEPL